MSVVVSRASRTPAPSGLARSYVVLVASLALIGCAGSPAGPETPAAAQDIVAPTASADSATAVSTSNQAGAVAPVWFFRAQEPACRAHARKYGNPQVESARFISAKLVRALGKGSFLISDGLGTRLVVRPSQRVVLPASGNEADEMPAPYGAGCPPEVFKGTSD